LKIWDTVFQIIAGMEQSMSKTDIYKSREEVRAPAGDSRVRKGHRRRSSSRLQTFEEQNRKRRSKNSGFRRLLHLMRKSENEKIFWWGLLGTFIVLLIVVAVWQFLYVERAARKNSELNERRPAARSMPGTESAAE
jgi:hypothetical protein